MHFKLIVVMVEDHHTDEILAASREAGATGATVLNQARGEGLSPAKTFLGLSIGTQVDLILMLVEEHLSRHILEKIARVGQFDETPGTGIAFQVDVEDAIGVRHQISALTETVEDRI
ncbi:P-II family nitrogen regulator [Pseudomonadota bacterium]